MSVLSTPRASLAATVYTIGHSTRPATELAGLLSQYQIAVLVDTRTIPRSRHNPQFNPEQLAPFLAEHGIQYQHQPLLGGLRRARKDSPNTAWRNASFRGYADYMQTAPFGEGIAALEALASQRTVAVMCAELVWWRCHRRMIADRLAVDGFDVLHLMTPGAAPSPHKLSPGLVVVVDREIRYPGAQPELPFEGALT
jgi:uncharacterized protein (DUF488 family)